LIPQQHSGISRGQLQTVASGGGSKLGHSGGSGIPVRIVLWDAHMVRSHSCCGTHPVPGSLGLQVTTWGQRGLVGVGVTFMLLIVVIPFANVFIQAFSHGLGPFVEVVQEPDFQQVRQHTPLYQASLPSKCVAPLPAVR
jgi:sulfate transport system permease protein